jgi:hypothetical protein
MKTTGHIPDTLMKEARKIANQERTTKLWLKKDCA